MVNGILDETWCDTYDPYENAVEANVAFLEYCNTVLSERNDWIEP